jgi:hypothetical protein
VADAVGPEIIGAHVRALLDAEAVSMFGGSGRKKGYAPRGPSRRSVLQRHVLENGLPEALERKLREQSYDVVHLDPDIAIKKSWSPMFKIVAQRQRNFERLVAHRFYDSKWDEIDKAIDAVIGWKPSEDDDGPDDCDDEKDCS